MPIVTLLNHARTTLPTTPHPILREAGELRRCYLTGLALQAYSDLQLHPEERALFLSLAELFEMNATEAETLLVKAGTSSVETVAAIRRALLHTKYVYYFILDLQIMALQDGVLKPVEAEVIKAFAEILEVDPADCAFLVDLAAAVHSGDPAAKAEWLTRFQDRKGLPQAEAPENFTHYTAS